jgi:hypothetical protein
MRSIAWAGNVGEGDLNNFIYFVIKNLRLNPEGFSPKRIATIKRSWVFGNKSIHDQ